MIDISKNVYFNVLDEIVNKYNNTVHRTTEMKPIDVTDNSYAECNENFNKLVIMLEFPWTYVISGLNGEGITPSFYEKELQKANEEKFRTEKVLKINDDK